MIGWSRVTDENGTRRARVGWWIFWGVWATAALFNVLLIWLYLQR